MSTQAVATRPISTLVQGYRDTIGYAPEHYDGDHDVIAWLLTDTPGRTWTPSEVARATGLTTNAARLVLEELARDGDVKHDPRGAWTRYYSRHRR